MLIRNEAFWSTPSLVCQAAYTGGDSYTTGDQSPSDTSTAGFSCWVYPTSSGSNRQIHGAANLYTCRLLSGNTVQVQLRDSTPADVLLVTSTTALTINSWNHVAWDWNKSGSYSMYINGTLDTASPTTGPSSSTDARFNRTLYCLGAHLPGPAQQSSARIAELYFGLEYLNLGTNLTKFRTSGGKPADLGYNGSTPTGTAPLQYHSLRSGDALSAFFTNRGSGGNLTQVDGATGWSIAASSPSD